MLLLLANSLSKGHSGVRPELVELLLGLLERDVLPVVPSRGSVGASGDLAPLAHVAVVLCGEGRATYGGEELDGGEALRRAGLAPIELAAKEGLALINGTHLMAACGGARAARRAAAAGCRHRHRGALARGLHGLDDAVRRAHPRSAPAPRAGRGRGPAARPARGQRRSSRATPTAGACRIPYTLRCVPQVLGAIADALDYVEGVLERELDAVTDNPLLFPDDGEACSGGNFHGQPLSLALDHLGLALCELASFAERRTYALLSPSYAGLPRFLTPHPGLSSGPHDRASTRRPRSSTSARCSRTRPAPARCRPRPAWRTSTRWARGPRSRRARSSTAPRTSWRSSSCARARAIEFHRPLRSTPALEGALAAVRERVPRLEQDRSLSAEVGAWRRSAHRRTGAVDIGPGSVGRVSLASGERSLGRIGPRFDQDDLTRVDRVPDARSTPPGTTPS